MKKMMPTIYYQEGQKMVWQDLFYSLMVQKEAIYASHLHMMKRLKKFNG